MLLRLWFLAWPRCKPVKLILFRGLRPQPTLIASLQQDPRSRGISGGGVRGDNLACLPCRPDDHNFPLVIRVTLDKSPTSRGASPDMASQPPSRGCQGIRQKVMHESILSYANVHRCRDRQLGADTNLLPY